MNSSFILQENSAVDYLPATKYGDLVFVIGSNQRLVPYTQSVENDLITEQIRTALLDFNPSEDFLLCTGSPTIMALCASELGPDLKRILNWDNRMRDYFIVENMWWKNI